MLTVKVVEGQFYKLKVYFRRRRGYVKAPVRSSTLMIIVFARVTTFNLGLTALLVNAFCITFSGKIAVYPVVVPELL